MEEAKNIRSYIKNVLEKIMEQHSFESIEQEFLLPEVEAILDEERITNKEAAEDVRNKSNFVGSHTYGEDLGELGDMYVAYSYGEEHPLYVYYDGTWYHNYEDYIKPDGEINKWTRKHLNDLRPNSETQGRPTSFLKKIIKKFKDTHNLGDNSHTDVPPGEK